MDEREASDSAASRLVRRRRLVAALVLFLSFAVNAATGHLGIRYGLDSARYADAGRHLLAGEPLEEKQANYLGYDLVVAADIAVHGGARGLVALNLLLMVLAGAAVWSLAGELGGEAAAWVATLLFMVNPEMARWNFYVLTESPYSSMVVIALWTVHHARARGGAKSWLVAIAALLLAASLRPNGWLLPPIALGYLLWTWLPSTRRKVLALSAIAALFLLVVIAGPLRRGVQAEGLSHELRIGEIVWNRIGVPLNLAMPPEPAIPETLQGSVRYVALHPGMTARLVFLRVYYHLADIRPYYSALHNALILAGLLPVYIAALIGAARTWKRPLAVLLLLVIAAHIGIVAVSFANWDGRFLLYMLPLVFVFAGCGIAVVASGGRRNLPTVAGPT